jgi:hypothetical protein
VVVGVASRTRNNEKRVCRPSFDVAARCDDRRITSIGLNGEQDRPVERCPSRIVRTRRGFIEAGVDESCVYLLATTRSGPIVGPGCLSKSIKCWRISIQKCHISYFLDGAMSPGDASGELRRPFTCPHAGIATKQAIGLRYCPSCLLSSKQSFWN